MNILQMVDVSWDSGLAHYALILAHALAGRGHRVFVSARPDEKPWRKAQRLGLPTIPHVSLGSLGKLRRFLEEERIELINAHTGATHSLAVLAAVGRRIAVVRTRADQRRPHLRPTSGPLHARTARIIAAAEYLRRTYLDVFHLAPEKVVTIYQGIDLSTFAAVSPLATAAEAIAAADAGTTAATAAGPTAAADTGTTAAEAMAASDAGTAFSRRAAPALGIVARLDPVKGHRYLLEAVALLAARGQAVELRIAGEAANLTEDELRSQARDLGLESSVRFVGFLADVPEFMTECDAGVISSTGSEAVSRVAIEWMSCGRPLVATRVGCLPEMVRSGVTGELVEPRDAAALAAGIETLLRDSSARASMGHAARREAEERFSIERFAAETERVYQAALTEGRC